MHHYSVQVPCSGCTVGSCINCTRTPHRCRLSPMPYTCPPSTYHASTLSASSLLGVNDSSPRRARLLFSRPFLFFVCFFFSSPSTTASVHIGRCPPATILTHTSTRSLAPRERISQALCPDCWGTHLGAMSTPTTAVATLPHYHHHAHHHAHGRATHAHHSHFVQPHHPHHSGLLHPSSVSTVPNRRSTASYSVLQPSSSVLTASTPSSSTASRLPPYSEPVSHTADGHSSSTAAIARTHRLQSPPAPPPPAAGRHQHHSHVEPRTPTTPRHRIDPYDSNTMASVTATATTTTMAAGAGSAADDPPSRKRRRSREPDWNAFYRNGLPSEIIVIDDTPEPEANTGRKMTVTSTNGYLPTTAAATSASATKPGRPQPAKRRRRDDGVAAPGYHVQYVGSHTMTPLQKQTQKTASTPNGSTLSSEGMNSNSVHNTTAPTSLSSNSQPEEVAAPLKRKRTTRQQTANDAKRRDIEGLSGQLLTYQPPPLPLKKVSEVYVRVVHDVSYHVRFFIELSMELICLNLAAVFKTLQG